MPCHGLQKGPSHLGVLDDRTAWAQQPDPEDSRRGLSTGSHRKSGANPEYGEEVSPCHSITSSARARSEAGRARPSDRAVFKLMTSSKLLCACTGRSPGLSPLKIRST